MPAVYTPVTLDDIKATLLAERGWIIHAPPGSHEYIAIRELTTLPGVQIKVYTSIPVGNEHARGCGQDAIRVVAIRKVGNEWRGLVKTQRVHRTQNWKTNLMTRIENVFHICKQRTQTTRG